MPCLRKLIFLSSSKLEKLTGPILFFSSQVLFLICRKLISQQIVNGTDVLKWLREILICRNKFLLKNKVLTIYSSQSITLAEVMTQKPTIFINDSLTCSLVPVSAHHSDMGHCLLMSMIQAKIQLLGLNVHNWLGLGVCTLYGGEAMCKLLFFFLSMIIPGVCHHGWWHSHLPAGTDKAGGVSLHVLMELRHWGGAGGHVLFPPPLWGGWHPQHSWRSAGPDNPAQLCHLQWTSFCQHHDGNRSVLLGPSFIFSVWLWTWHPVKVLFVCFFLLIVFFFYNVQQQINFSNQFFIHMDTMFTFINNCKIIFWFGSQLGCVHTLKVWFELWCSQPVYQSVNVIHLSANQSSVNAVIWQAESHLFCSINETWRWLRPRHPRTQL